MKAFGGLLLLLSFLAVGVNARHRTCGDLDQPACQPEGGSIKLYQHFGMKGKELHFTDDVNILGEENFNDVASSVIVESGTWQLFEHYNYHGAVTILGPGSYSNPTKMGLKNDVMSSLRLMGTCKTGLEPIEGVCKPDCGGLNEPVCRAGSIKLYEHFGMKGKALVFTGDVNALGQENFNDVASSVIVESGTWQLFQHYNYHGAVTILGPGSYSNPTEMGLTNDVVSSLRYMGTCKTGLEPIEGICKPDCGGLNEPVCKAGSIKLYQHYGMKGKALVFTDDVNALGQENFNDVASSVIVESGTWQLFEHYNYRGAVTILGPGSYSNPTKMGLKNDVMSSLRLMGTCKPGLEPIEEFCHEADACEAGACEA